MLQAKSSWIQFVNFVFYLNQHQPIKAYKDFIYMTNYCSMSVHVGNSLLLDLTPVENLPDDRHGDFLQCDIDLLAPMGSSLMAHLLQLDISPAPNHSDRLHFVDLATNIRLTPGKGLYGKLYRSSSIFDVPGKKIKDYRTTSNKLKLEYLGKPTKHFPGFKLLVSSFQAPSGTSECQTTYYYCRRTAICISHQLVCDKHPNCGEDDTGDEDACNRRDMVTNLLVEYSLTRDIICALLLPLATFLIVALVVLIISRRYIRTKVETTQITKVNAIQRKARQQEFREERAETYHPPIFDQVINMNTGFGAPPAYQRLICPEKQGNAAQEEEIRLSNILEETDMKHNLKKKQKNFSDSNSSSSNLTEEL